MKKLLLETSFSKIYMIVMIIITLLILGGYFSYAMFTVSKEKGNAISIVTGNLEYKLTVDEEETNKLTVESNYLVKSLDSGIVVFIGDKDKYGKTVIIQQMNGVDVFYGNVTSSVNMYDYVEKGSLIGETIDTNLYLAFQKEGSFVDYKEYIK